MTISNIIGPRERGLGVFGSSCDLREEGQTNRKDEDHGSKGQMRSIVRRNSSNTMVIAGEIGQNVA